MPTNRRSLCSFTNPCPTLARRPRTPVRYCSYRFACLRWSWGIVTGLGATAFRALVCYLPLPTLPRRGFASGNGGGLNCEYGHDFHPRPYLVAPHRNQMIMGTASCSGTNSGHDAGPCDGSHTSAYANPLRRGTRYDVIKSPLTMAAIEKRTLCQACSLDDCEWEKQALLTAGRRQRYRIAVAIAGSAGQAR
jgi:hypothetical protein